MLAPLRWHTPEIAIKTRVHVHQESSLRLCCRKARSLGARLVRLVGCSIGGSFDLINLFEDVTKLLIALGDLCADE